ncbi:DUF2938 family protein [Novosphingobium decolorationis]|uniref:DUF2938 family protein n=1 Tax=Novosphingobium decolorationis TaxID=2698673 RepID=A0ABX8DZL1_9SPHN|nr:DUF2938 family protein [Novosphingobium decolorationis]QVM82320.1 DUF2938 family protein [Novosphingobium decolorationis]
METALTFTLVVGLGATVALDVWARQLRGWFGIAGADWGLVGQWLVGLPAGRMVHTSDGFAMPSRGERALGWSFHYLVGLVYAAVYPLVWGEDFLAAPKVGPFALVGFALSTLAGLCVLTPAMGGGLLASRTPDQGRRIALMLLNHAVFAGAQYALALGLVTAPT